MRSYFYGFVVAASLLAACGGGDPSASEIFSDGIEQSCAKAFECKDSFPSGQGITFEQIYGTSESMCVSTFESFVDPDAIQASVDAGRIEYNAGDAQACLDAGLDVTCEQFWAGTNDAPECDTAFQGTVATGGECTTDLDCSSSGDSCTDGVCTAG